MKPPLFLVLALSTVACRATPPAVAPTRASAPVASSVSEAALPRSIEGRPLVHHVLGPAEDVATTVLFFATIHGDESAGTPLLEEFVRRATADPALLNGARVLVVPVSNPDGLARDSRTNARRVDLNRNFPASNFKRGGARGPEPLSEPESRFLHDLVERYEPSRVLAFHQAANCIDYDGPGGSLAHRLAACSPLEVRRMGTRPGSFGAWAGHDSGIAIVTIELPAGAERLAPDAAWERYGMLLVESLR